MGSENDGTAIRPTSKLCQAQMSARPAATALHPSELGSARATRHSFARSFLRTAADQRWTVTTQSADLDPDGRGEVVYAIDAAGTSLWFVAFSTTIEQAERTDRVIAESWDVTAALGQGPLDTRRLDSLRRHVPLQEGGRADVDTLVWTRANRSSRFFDYVVQRLAGGQQPERDVVGDGAYVLRSTAFYGNGKWGLTDFDQIPSQHPLAVPYRAQMLAAWLLRELSCDLVEHVARCRSEAAVELHGDWRRYFGLGNATGLGMVPFVVRHPRMLDAWVALRELPLARALTQDHVPHGSVVARIERDLRRAAAYFGERDALPSAPYPRGSELAADLLPLADQVGEYRQSGAAIGGRAGCPFALALHEEAASSGRHVRQVVDTVLVECDDTLDGDVEALLRCDERVAVDLAQRCDSLVAQLKDAYHWIDAFDFAEPDRTHYFWYCSANNEEPRRGTSGVDDGDSVAFPIDIARQVGELIADLRRFEPSANLADFLVAHPWHRAVIERVQGLTGVRYGEAHVNPLDRDFLPLDLQRFQLATFGMENFSPQSTDWLRVTLFSGAPRAADVVAGVDDDWLFNLKPGVE